MKPTFSAFNQMILDGFSARNPESVNLQALTDAKSPRPNHTGSSLIRSGATPQDAVRSSRLYTAVKNSSLRSLILLGLLLGGATGSMAQTLQYPSDAGFYNVKNYGATGNGTTDDTAAIQSAFTAATNAARSGFNEVYFPPGTYVVSSTLYFSTNMSLAKRLVLRGSGKDVTTVKLADGAPAFQNPAAPLPVINPCPGCSSSVSAFMTQIDDLTISVGNQNPGATGVQMTVNNAGGMRDVNITGPVGSGAVGLDLSQTYQGPSLYDNVTISGFRVGVKMSSAQYTTLLKDLTLTNQTTAGITASKFIFTVDGLSSTNTVPAVSLSDGSFASIAHATLSAPSPTTNPAIIVPAGSALHLNGVSIGSGYAPTTQTASQVSVGRGQVDCATVYSISHVTTYQGNCSPMNLPTVRAQIPLADALSSWTKPAALTEAAVRSAMSSGASTIYLPNPGKSQSYVIGSTLVIPATVKRLIGFGSRVSLSQSFNAQTPLFSVAARTTPLIVEDIDFTTIQGAGQVIFSNDHNDTDVIIRDIYSFPYGPVLYSASASASSRSISRAFLLNVAGSSVINNGQTIYGWQVNLEQSGTHLVNNGGTVWIYGLKNENAGSMTQTINGGDTEIFGGFVLENATVPLTQPEFDVVNGKTCVSYAEASNFPSGRGKTQFTILMGSSETGQALYNVSDFPTFGLGHFYVNVCGSM